MARMNLMSKEADDQLIELQYYNKICKTIMQICDQSIYSDSDIFLKQAQAYAVQIRHKRCPEFCKDLIEDFKQAARNPSVEGLSAIYTQAEQMRNAILEQYAQIKDYNFL